MFSTARRLAVFAAVVVCIAAADAPRGAFGVGVLRQDGVLIPFATFDGKRWRNTWPAPELDLIVPISVGSIPSRWWGPTGPLDTWQAWIGRVSRSVRVVQPDWVNVHCARHVGLRTDYHKELSPPDTVQPYPKDGLAVSPPQPVEPIENIPIAATAIQAMAPALLAAFNRAERETEDRFGHPISRRARERVEPLIEAVYAFGDSPRVYYIEAVRGYRELGRECTAVSIGTGWFTSAPTETKPLLMTVDVLNCNRRGASYMLPLGALRIGARMFWIAQFSGWDHERYAVVEITPKTAEAVVSTWGGGC